MNLLTCINIDEYRDALCKIGNEMHSHYRYSHSRLSRTSAVRTAAKLPILTPLHNINRQNVMANKFILGRLGENQPYKVLM